VGLFKSLTRLLEYVIMYYMTNKNKENLSEFIIVRVSINEKIELRKRALDSKNLSKYIRRQLGLKDEK